MQKQYTKEFWKNIFGDDCKIYFKTPAAFSCSLYRIIKKQPDGGMSFHGYIWENHCEAVHYNKKKGDYLLAKV